MGGLLQRMRSPCALGLWVISLTLMLLPELVLQSILLGIGTTRDSLDGEACPYLVAYPLVRGSCALETA